MRRNQRMSHRARATNRQHEQGVIFTEPHPQRPRQRNQQHEQRVEKNWQSEKKPAYEQRQPRAFFAEHTNESTHDFIRRAAFHDANADNRRQCDDNSNLPAGLAQSN